MLKDPDGFRNFLIKNLSFPVNMTQALLNATVNGTKVTQFCCLIYYSTNFLNSVVGDVR